MIGINTKPYQCPFCGGEPVEEIFRGHDETQTQFKHNVNDDVVYQTRLMVRCTEDGCPIKDIWIPKYQWNSRPIEDEIAGDKCELEEKLYSIEEYIGKALSNVHIDDIEDLEEALDTIETIMYYLTRPLDYY